MLFHAKAILLKQKWNYLTHSLEDKGVHAFPTGICLKGNVRARLRFELAFTILQAVALTITPRGQLWSLYIWGNGYLLGMDYYQDESIGLDGD